MSSGQSVYISFATVDQSLVDPVITRLQEEDFEVSQPARGEPVDRSKIESCDQVLVVLSEQALATADPQIKAEWSVAAKRIREEETVVSAVLPVALDAFDVASASLPPEIKDAAWFQFDESHEVDQLQETVDALAAARKERVSFPALPSGKSVSPFDSGHGVEAPKASKSGPSKTVIGAAILAIGAIGAVLLVTGPDINKDSPPPPDSASPPPAVATAPQSAVAPPPVEEDAEPQATTAPESFVTTREVEDPPKEELPPTPQPASLPIQKPPTDPHARELWEAEKVLAQTLDLENYTANVRRIVSGASGKNSSWLPPSLLGIQRDFANQRRAIRAGAGSLHLQFEGVELPPDVALTESYLDEGNWQLARHFARQMNRHLGNQSLSTTQRQLTTALSLLAEQDTKALDLIRRVASGNSAETRIAREMLLRSLVLLGRTDEAIQVLQSFGVEFVEEKAGKLFFAPPFDRLHVKEEFKAVVSEVIGISKYDTAMATVKK